MYMLLLRLNQRLRCSADVRIHQKKTRLIAQLKTPCDKEICNVIFIVKRKSNVCNNILANKNIQVNHRVNPMQLLYYLALKFVKLDSCPAHEMLIHFCKKKKSIHILQGQSYTIQNIHELTNAGISNNFGTCKPQILYSNWRCVLLHLASYSVRKINKFMGPFFTNKRLFDYGMDTCLYHGCLWDVIDYSCPKFNGEFATSILEYRYVWIIIYHCLHGCNYLSIS